ncbi:MAG: hypothetical protein M1158_02900 [Candidatus Marsarchaeota archaeon]|jgi:hypothetical protein|nr:hypothetical protein [Candidatus Marsarchaeota archaeon]
MDARHRRRILAKYEIGWWMWHGRKDFDKATAFMIKEYQLQFGMPYSRAKLAVGYRIKAAKMHDIAEDLERNGHVKEGAKYWKRVERLLERHFRIVVG